MQEQGFAVVEHVAVTEENILSAIEDFEHKIEHYDIPSDGLVLTYEVSATDSPWAEPRSSPEIPLLSNGRMNCGRLH